MSEEEAGPAIERDFDAIEAAVMQTERGRWFLAEYHRRNRVADTQLLLDAISRLGQAVGEPRPPRLVAAEGWPDVEGAVANARTALAVDPFDATLPLSRLFGRMIRVARSSSGDILESVERIQEAAWALRESGAEPGLCDELDGCASRIMQAAAEGTVSETRSDAVRDAIRAVEERLAAMRADRLGLTAASADRPLRPEAAPDSDGERSTPAPEPEPPAAETVARPVPASLAAIDAIEFRQRLKLFT